MNFHVIKPKFTRRNSFEVILFGGKQRYNQFQEISELHFYLQKGAAATNSSAGVTSGVQ